MRNKYKLRLRETVFFLIMFWGGYHVPAAWGNPIGPIVPSYQDNKDSDNLLQKDFPSKSSVGENLSKELPSFFQSEEISGILLRNNEGSIGGLPEELPVKSSCWILIFSVIGYGIYKRIRLKDQLE